MGDALNNVGRACRMFERRPRALGVAFALGYVIVAAGQILVLAARGDPGKSSRRGDPWIST